MSQIHLFITKDIESLRKLCLKSSIPPTYRPKVWKILLGVLPIFPETWEFIQIQNKDQYDDIKRTGQILFKSFPGNSENTSEIASELDEDFKEYSQQVATVARLYNVDCYLDMEVSNKKIRGKKNIPDIAKVFCAVFQDQVDAYFCHKELVNLRIKSNEDPTIGEPEIIEKLISKLHDAMKKKQPDLLNHFKSLNIHLDQFCYSWFINYFASCLPTLCLKKIWDRIVSVGDSLLPSYAFAILSETSPLLMACTKSTAALDILMTVIVIFYFFYFFY